MNKKQEVLEKVIDICIDACNTELRVGTFAVTKEQILSKERIGEIAHWTRCILVSQLWSMGYTPQLIALKMNRNLPTIHDMRNKSYDFRKASFAYRVAYNEVEMKCKELMATYEIDKQKDSLD